MTNKSNPPTSYASLPYTQIKLSHHPPTSPTPTAIIILTLHRPNAHNAFTDTMATELVSAYTHFHTDARVKCIVLTAQGRIFCAGADLSTGFTVQSPTALGHRDSGGRVALAIHQCAKPTITALTGSAVGVGITLTLPTAIRIAYAGAKVGFVFARRGIVMEAASAFFLPRLIGYGRAMHLVTTGATYLAGDKLLEGLFSEVVDSRERVMERALEIAEEVASRTSVVSTFLMREMMWRGPESAESAHLLASRVLWDLFRKSDNKEGVKAFLEKRDVQFTGTMEEGAPDVWPWWDKVDTETTSETGKMSKL